MKVFILTTVMAPYRVQLFSEIGKQCELYVCFEQMRDSDRNEKWYDGSSANFHLVNLKKWDASLNTVKFEVVKKVRSLQPDVVIAYEYHTPTALYLLKYCQRRHIPYIINCDGAFVSKSLKDIVKKFYISRASGFISSGMMADEYLLHYGAAKERIYHNHFTSLHDYNILPAVPSAQDKQQMKERKGIPEKRMVLSVGQFIHRKGYDLLLKAAKALSEDIGVYIIGGRVTPEYERLVQDLQLTNVHFIDFMSPDELRCYYLAADLFVLPTREDVWGLVINEAMAYALPIVTTDRCVAGIEMIKNEVNGYIVPVETVEPLSEAMNRILSDDTMRSRMAEENLKLIRDYTYETSAKDIACVIRGVYEKNIKKI